MRFYSVLIGCAAVLIGANLACADTVPVTFSDVEFGSDVTITLSTPGQNNYVVSGEVGVYQWTQNTTSSKADGLSTAFNTFCIDLYQDISIGAIYNVTTSGTVANNTYQVTLPAYLAPVPGGGGMLGASGQMSQNQADDLAALWAQDTSKINSIDTAATFQFAVWDIVYGAQYLAITPYGSYGPANLTTDVQTAAQWATPIGSTTPVSLGSKAGLLDPNGNSSNIVGLSSQDYQDQIVLSGTNNPNGGFTTAAPLPASAGTSLVLLAGCGLIGYTLRKRLTVI